MSPHLKKSVNEAHLENNTFEQIVTHFERELELNGLEAPDELQTISLNQQATNTNADRPKPTCYHCKIRRHCRNQYRHLRRQKKQNRGTQSNSGNKNSGANSPIPDNSNNNKNNNNNNKNYKNSDRDERKPKTAYPSCETCGKTNQYTEFCYFRANSANRPPPPNRGA